MTKEETATPKPKTRSRKRNTTTILKEEGAKALEALSKLKETVKQPPEKPKGETPIDIEAPIQKDIPKECLETVQLVKNFLKSCRNDRIKKGLMPDTPESHAEIEPLFYGLRPGDVNALKGNRLAIEPTNKAHSTLLRELMETCGTTAPGRATASPTTTPAGFLFHIEDICRLTAKPAVKPQEKTTIKLRRTAEACIAFLEILEEAECEPLPNGDEFSHRPKRYNPAVAALKADLLEQSSNEIPPPETPSVTDEEIAAETKLECREGMTTGDALQMAVILAERKIEQFRSTRKRETLFRMRCWLAHKYFEHTKKLRKDGHPADQIIRQKPRYKTPCVLLVRHPIYEHAEVVCIQPQSAVSYWGNPETEKDTHAVVRSTHQPEEETGIVARVKKSEGFARATRWIIAGILIQLLALGIYTGVQAIKTATNKKDMDATAQNMETESKPAPLEKEELQIQTPWAIETTEPTLQPIAADIGAPPNENINASNQNPNPNTKREVNATAIEW